MDGFVTAFSAMLDCSNFRKFIGKYNNNHTQLLIESLVINDVTYVFLL